MVLQLKRLFIMKPCQQYKKIVYLRRSWWRLISGYHIGASRRKVTWTQKLQCHFRFTSFGRWGGGGAAFSNKYSKPILQYRSSWCISTINFEIIWCSKCIWGYLISSNWTKLLKIQVKWVKHVKWHPMCSLMHKTTYTHHYINYFA